MFLGAALLLGVMPAQAHDGEHAAAPATAQASAESEIRALIHRQAAAIASMSIEGIAALVAAPERFSIVEGAHANWTWQDYRDKHLVPEFTSPNFKITAYEIGEIKVTVGHDLAFAVYDYVIKAEVKGKELAKKNYTTVVLTRTPKGWRILHEHS